jgi:hypothetical protein
VSGSRRGADFRPGSTKHFDLIRAAGMSPKDVGVQSPVAAILPPKAFFQRNGQHVKEMGRYQLNYHQPAVISRMDATINHLATDLGAGYFKFDYNLDITQAPTSTLLPPLPLPLPTAPATASSPTTAPTSPGSPASSTASPCSSPRATPVAANA